jgi:SAM-dependent methyltransferase
LKNLRGLWNGYAKMGYEEHYRARLNQEHLRKLTSLFITGSERVLDAGCGTGIMIPYILQRIQPKEIHLLDWSPAMLEKAKAKVEKWQNCTFKFHLGDLCENPSPFPNEFFDAIISNLVVCYLLDGWKKGIERLKEFLRPGGYLYLGTFLRGWRFDFYFLLRHAPLEFARNPIASLKELKYLKHRKIVNEITRVALEHGASFPTKDELLEYLKELGFCEIEALTTYWGHGIALRAKKSPFTKT